MSALGYQPQELVVTQLLQMKPVKGVTGKWKQYGTGAELCHVLVSTRSLLDLHNLSCRIFPVQVLGTASGKGGILSQCTKEVRQRDMVTLKAAKLWDAPWRPALTICQ